jgi:flagellar hook assembly protein FlgD
MRLRMRPNPFATSTSMVCWLPRAGHARLRVLDIGGRLIRTFTFERASSGEHAVVWDGRDDRGSRVAPGIYTVRLDAPGDPSLRADVGRIVLLD